MAANSRTRPGRPEGADAMGLRAVYAHIASLATANGADAAAEPVAPAPAKKAAVAKRRAPAHRRARR